MVKCKNSFQRISELVFSTTNGTKGIYRRLNTSENVDELHAVLFILCSPEKIGLGIELEINLVNIKIKLCGSRVGHTDAQIQEIWILAQLESWGNHDEQPMV